MVAKMTFVRTLLRVAVVIHWPLWQMDVKNTFLDGDLQETMYMQPPSGYAYPPSFVCQLKKSLYEFIHYDPIASKTRISQYIVFIENIPYYSLRPDSKPT